MVYFSLSLPTSNLTLLAACVPISGPNDVNYDQEDFSAQDSNTLPSPPSISSRFPSPEFGQVELRVLKGL